MNKDNILKKYNVSVPRYTSYPPANFFKDIDSESYVKAINDSNTSGESSISIYIHIPFCHELCHYCGCNMMVFNKNLSVELYINTLIKELKDVFGIIKKSRKVSQIHYGGGTPNSIDSSYLKKINNFIFSNFEIKDSSEIAVELHPAYLDEKYIDDLIEARFNRISIGIQDLDINVLKAINRLPSKLDLKDLFSYIREKSNININLDLIYGLPYQTTESFSKTIKKVIDIKPDRVVTFSYAHIPSIKPHQIALEKKGLPGSIEKKEIFDLSEKLLLSNGYKKIGLDHFVLEEDELYKAFTEKKLARNFQGYCSKNFTGQVYGFGTSAISQLDSGYFQNTKSIPEYIKIINSDTLSTKKGYIINNNEKLISFIIESLMCNYYLDLNFVSKKFGISIDSIKSVSGYDLEDIKKFEEDNILSFSNNILSVNDNGKIFIRNIASIFDPILKTNKKIFSKSL